MPLFETIEDLRNAPRILSDLIAVPTARRSLKRQGSRIEVMLGYSDSNKDGGLSVRRGSWNKPNARLNKRCKVSDLFLPSFTVVAAPSVAGVRQRGAQSQRNRQAP